MASASSSLSRHVIGLMDLGTNSIRLSVLRVNANHSITTLTRQREAIRLGDGEFGTNAIQQDAMDRAVLVCGKFGELARAYGVEEMIAVATSATRDAQNQAEFLHRLREEAHVDMRVISGSEEARLIYRGVSSGIELGEQTALFVDIGGGSTEVIVGTQRQHLFLDSMKLGAIRLANLYLAGHTTPITPEHCTLIKRYVRNTAIRNIQRIREFPISCIIGSSGTIENLANVTAQTLYKRPFQPNDVFSSAQLSETITLLCSLPLEERRRVPGLHAERADIIIGGAAVIDTLMEETGIDELRVSSRGLRDGLLVDYLARSGYATLVEEMGVRERSVVQLGRTCNIDEPHARNVQRLAGNLFDSAQEAGLHDLGSWERELLMSAAFLHDTGAFLSYHNHHAHSYYLVRNAELLGFDQMEVAIVAATAFFHRKTFPRKKHPEFTCLDERGQRIVRTLCILLRMAESLDRSHSGAVRQAHLRRISDTRVVLEIDAKQDCQLECWGVENHSDAFRKAFGLHMTVEHPLTPLPI